ncbi:type I phosphatidylinositol 4,5-bisphosphate 4-phosphatase-A isoform X1 [Tachysurus ichikawai]
MADGERSPLLSDLGDGAAGSGIGGLSPGPSPFSQPNKPQSEIVLGSTQTVHLQISVATLLVGQPAVCQNFLPEHGIFSYLPSSRE